jgi:hypothetical protein
VPKLQITKYYKKQVPRIHCDQVAHIHPNLSSCGVASLGLRPSTADCVDPAVLADCGEMTRQGMVSRKKNWWWNIMFHSQVKKQSGKIKTG